MTDKESTSKKNEQITLVTYWANQEPPSKYHAFASREAAIAWLESEGVDTSELEEYTRPAGRHESVTDPEDDRWNYSIRELEVRGRD